MAASNSSGGRSRQQTWLVIGASRGIGYEFVEQAFARGDNVIATVRKDAASFWPKQRDCKVLTCDVSHESSIDVRQAIQSCCGPMET